MDRATSITHAAAATAVTIGGFATGLYYDVLLAGFAGALASLSYHGGMSIWRRMWSLVTSSLAAGYTAPAFATYMAQILPGMSSKDQGVLVFSGFVMGLAAQTLIPAAMETLKGRLNGFNRR